MLIYLNSHHLGLLLAKMKKTIVFLFSLLFSISAFAQHPKDRLVGELNVKFLEHLIKEGVDSVRKSKGLAALGNDSILYIASLHHSKDQKKNGKISHNESSRKYKDPQARAEAYGAVNYLVGENVQVIPYNVLVKEKATKQVKTYDTYEKLARAFVIGWVNSKGHYKNMISPDYQITGVSVAVDSKSNEVYSTQKFAAVLWKYNFEESSTMFPYSNYQVPETPTSLEDVNVPFRTRYPHGLQSSQKLSAEKLQYVNSLIDYAQDHSFLEIERGNIYLKMHLDAQLFLNFLEGRKDGLAIEVVSYNDYDCGNPEFYIDPARRNKRSEITDTVLIPIYKKDLMKGFKPRRKSTYKRIKKEIKKNKEESLYNNILKGVYIPYSPDEFKYKLGKIPKGVNGYQEINLVYIKDKSIVRVKHFTGICGEYYTEFNPIELLTDSAIFTYVPVPKEKDYQFDFFFQKGKSAYKYQDLKPALDSLTDDEFIVTEIEINAYSSVEGNDEINKEIQEKRAQSIVEAFATKSKLKVAPLVASHSSWEKFKVQIETDSTLSDLRGYSDQQLKDSLQQKDFVAQLEPLLKMQRFAEVKISTLYDLNDSTIQKYVVQEYNRFQSKLKEFEEPLGPGYFAILDTQLAMQTFAFRGIKEGRIHDQIFNEFEDPSMKYQVALYNNLYVYQEQLGVDYGIDHEDLSSYADLNSFSPTLAFNYLKKAVKDWDGVQSPRGIKMKDWGSIYSTLIYELPNRIDEVEQLNINYLFKAAKYYFEKDDWNNKNEAAAWIFDFYSKKKITEEHALKLAKGFAYIQVYAAAYAILQPFYETSKNEELLALASKLSYSNPLESKSEEYVNELIALRKRMTQQNWCSMFVGPCNISFQVMDSEAMRNFYCEECAEIGNYGNQPEQWEED